MTQRQKLLIVSHLSESFDVPAGCSTLSAGQSCNLLRGKVNAKEISRSDTLLRHLICVIHI